MKKPGDWKLPLGWHVGIIMDGNGRWAVSRGRPRVMGHRVGAQVVKRVVEMAPSMGIGVLTLYAFSSDNWRRPPREVAGLMRLFRSYLASETARCVKDGVRLCVMGRRDRLPGVLLRAIEAAEKETARGQRLLLRIAIDYSARDAIIAAAARTEVGAAPSREQFAASMAEAMHSPSVPDIDLLIRTGGEQRLSDFLLWECAYAELYFDECLWPDFGETELRAAIEEFRRRDRRFGGVAQAAAG
jgi:undecaprenyl diphosphate synthase